MTKPDGILGKWNYGTTPQFPYGDETSYQKAMDFLDGPYIIEDWGSGVSWARKFVKRGRYIGLDGSWSHHCDQVVDLRTYRSQADAILLRHVLEHNLEWQKIIENALASFQRKLVLILFTPFSESTHVMTMGPVGGGNDTVPDISFKREDILKYLLAEGLIPGTSTKRRLFYFTEESLVTATQYGQEHIFYIEKYAPRHGDPDSPTKTDPVTGLRGYVGVSGFKG